MQSAHGSTHDVGKTEVDCECDYSRHETCPQSAGKVGDVADEPDNEEGQGDAVGRAGLVVFDQLRDLGIVRALIMGGIAVSWSRICTTRACDQTSQAAVGRRTSRKTQDASEMLPQTPDRTSLVVSGMLAAAAAAVNMCSMLWVCTMQCGSGDDWQQQAGKARVQKNGRTPAG
jgi:hypothetical protein